MKKQEKIKLNTPRVLKVAVVVFMAIALSACNKKVKPVDEADLLPKQDAQTMLIEGERWLAQGKYQRALDIFGQIENYYPFTQQAKQARLEMIYAYYQREEFNEAIAVARQFLKLYPRDEHADYVYYMKGIANFEVSHGLFMEFLPLDLAKRDLSHEREAFEDFGQLIANYPNSRYVPDAQKRMVFLRNLLAKQEVLIGEYYYHRGSYIAAANRAAFTVQHFEGAPQVVDALALLARSYHQLKLPDLVAQTMEVLAHNYPESKQYQRLIKHRSYQVKPTEDSN